MQRIDGRFGLPPVAITAPRVNVRDDVPPDRSPQIESTHSVDAMQDQPPVAKEIDIFHVLRQLVKDIPLIDLKRGDRKRKVFDVWKNVDGEMFNLSGNVNENKGKGITITVLHHSTNPISFAGIPLVLKPHRGFGESSEKYLQNSIRVEGESRASFSRLNPRVSTYTLKVGDSV